MITINLSTMVSLRNLTEHGKIVYQKYIDEVNKDLEDKGLSSRMKPKDQIELWVFMNIFGPWLWNGGEIVVENNSLRIDD